MDRTLGGLPRSPGPSATAPWAIDDADSCAVAGFKVPIVVVGERVQQRWPRLSKPEVPAFSTKQHQTETSVDAPAHLAATTSAYNVVGPLAPHDYLTHAQRRRRVLLERAKYPADTFAMRRDDTVNSIDTPSWMAAALETQAPPPALTSPAKSWVAGAKNRVFLSPLVEVDPFSGRDPRRVAFGGTPGFIPGGQDLARINSVFEQTGARLPRLGVTTAGDIGAGDGSVPVDRPSARLAGQERFGKTAAAAIGDERVGGALTDTLALESGAVGVVRERVDGAVYRAEPPFSDYFRDRRDALALPSLRETTLRARWTGQSPAELRSSRGASEEPAMTGHALFRALMHHHGEKAGQHLQTSQSFVAEELRRAGSPRAASDAYKSGPLKWYNATR